MPAVRYRVQGKGRVAKQSVSPSLDENLSWLKRYLGYKESFDILVREFEVAGHRCALVCVDSFIDQTVLTLIMQQLQKLPQDALEHPTMKGLLNVTVPFIEVTPMSELDEAGEQILSGPAAFLVDGVSHVIIVDVRKYPDRNPSEPSIERVLRGPKDGFVETLIFNTILIRRRLRDPNLRIEAMQVGRRSKTDVALVYIKDIADDRVVRLIRDRLKAIDGDAMAMSEKALQEWIVKKPWWNPFPNGKFTERPDVAAEHLTEGHVVVLIDTSPNALILPVSVFSFLQSVEEYHEDVMIGSYLKWVRFLGVLISWVLPPLWYALLVTHTHLPGKLDVLLKPTTTAIPIFWQLVGLEIGVDLLRLALTFSPDPLTQSMGFFGAILLGDIAIKAGLIDAEAMVFVAMAAVGTYTAPDIDFGNAVRLMRVFLLLMTGAFALVAVPWLGFALGMLIPMAVLFTNDSFGSSYAWPLLPFNGPAFAAELSRKPLNRKIMRPALTHPKDPTHRRPPVKRRQRI
ncbi:MAG: spore germination protein [Firmicutes bacterium]|nr:spore germination protein [Bacillota bacterium]